MQHLGTAGVLSMVALATGAVWQNTKATAESTSLPPLQEQVLQDLRGALRANAQATTYQEWAESGYTPKDVLQNVMDLKSQEAIDTLCEGLRHLNPEDLALFEEVLEPSPEREPLPCAAVLKKRLTAYWQRASEKLNLRQSLKADRAPVTLPSTEMHIDTDKGPIYPRGENKLKPGEIALTFDDGPHPTRTQAVLQILAEAGVRATFFEVGEAARAHPEISKEVAQAGHTVGSHSWSHANLVKLGTAEAEEEINTGREVVASASGTDVPFFRFPYGSRTKALEELVSAKKLASFFWNIDTLDWKIRDPEALLKHVITELDRAKGGIILFHDVHQQTVLVLPHVIEELKARGLTSVVFVPH